ncbi:Type 2A phosphatase-associated protein 42 [Coemansia sp. RSA 1822]|nr:Type 2A phosphatase-associated protein 42 [Coemansia sp. RSA 638]KAJ2544545.1 Type 2A phosphatase-associated protein 42 [Coemansia sp. RSA 1853]KAJ2563908.1 Type 2A phosphatase-associated protein 42 [Coemansia sp. RSA 1822]
MEDTNADVSVGLGFSRAQQQLKSLASSNLASTSDEYQKQVQSVAKQLQRCIDKIQQLSLFSSNETTDDYSTSELKLILATAYLGDVLQKTTLPNTRVSVLEQALANYQKFLATCQDLSIIKHTGKVQKAKQADAGQTRMQKIERFKQQRAMEQETKELEARLMGDDDDLEEVERELAIKLVLLKVHQVQDDIHLVERELEMARQMADMKRSRDEQQDDRAPSSEWRLDPHSYNVDLQTGQQTRPIFNERGQPTRPFVLTNNRQMIKDQVFRPGWALPTMSVDEYLQQEQERGNIISGGGKEPEPKAEIDDNDYDALDAEVVKQREWDDFKDDNPRGAGNMGGNRG